MSAVPALHAQFQTLARLGINALCTPPTSTIPTGLQEHSSLLQQLCNRERGRWCAVWRGQFFFTLLEGLLLCFFDLGGNRLREEGSRDNTPV